MSEEKFSLVELERLRKALVEWERTNRFSSEYSQERADFDLYVKQHADHVIDELKEMALIEHTIDTPENTLSMGTLVAQMQRSIVMLAHENTSLRAKQLETDITIQNMTEQWNASRNDVEFYKKENSRLYVDAERNIELQSQQRKKIAALDQRLVDSISISEREKAR